MLVCNPVWLAERASEGVLVGLHYLIVSRFDIDEIRQFLANLAAGTVGLSWEEVAAKLGKIGRWEFDDYKESAWTEN